MDLQSHHVGNPGMKKGGTNNENREHGDYGWRCKPHKGFIGWDKTYEDQNNQAQKCRKVHWENLCQEKDNHCAQYQEKESDFDGHKQLSTVLLWIEQLSSTRVLYFPDRSCRLDSPTGRYLIPVP